jgi:hypothetical protein
MQNSSCSPSELKADFVKMPFVEGLSDAIGKAVARHHPNSYRTVWTPEHTFSMMIRAARAGTTSLTSMVTLSNAERRISGQQTHSVHTSAPSEARKRLCVEVFKDVNSGLNHSLQTQNSETWNWKGLRVTLVDGTTFNMLDTKANQEFFPQHGKQNEGAGFPIARAVVFVSHASQAIQDIEYTAWRGKETGEMALFRQAYSRQKDKLDLILADRYYASFFTMALMVRDGKHAVFQIHAARKADFRKGQILGNGDHIVEWERPQRPQWMSKEEYESYPRSIRVREIRCKARRKDKKALILVTTLLDISRYSASEICQLYKERWDAEEAYKNFKSKCGAGFIDAKTPEIFEKLLWAHIISYNCTRWHICNAASLHDLKPRVLSYKKAVELLRENFPLLVQCSSIHEVNQALLSIYRELVHTKSKIRTGRSYRREIKGKRSTKYPKAKTRTSIHKRAA